MSMLSFAKYHGAGNDFVLIDDRSRSFPFHDSNFIQKLCDRKIGIGADGLILLADDPSADFRMRIFNSDGFEAESCGNGLRCLARFIQDLGFKKNTYKIAAGNRTVEVWFERDLVGVDMGLAEGLQLGLDTELGVVHFVDTGVPHVVQFVKDVEAVDLTVLGPLLRHHPKFQPKGANVNFVSRISETSFRARTFERGVEGETLACGTGAVAIGVVAKNLYKTQMPFSICFRGGELRIDEKEGRLIMIGPAVKVFVSYLNLGAML